MQMDSEFKLPKHTPYPNLIVSNGVSTENISKKINHPW